jgi:hypothetical protein
MFFTYPTLFNLFSTLTSTLFITLTSTPPPLGADLVETSHKLAQIEPPDNDTLTCISDIIPQISSAFKWHKLQKWWMISVEYYHYGQPILL